MAPSETARAPPADAGSDPRKASCLAADDFQIAQKRGALQAQTRRRRAHLVSRLRALGNFALNCALQEIEEGASVDDVLATYAYLPRAFVLTCTGQPTVDGEP
jgi:hypothetical protein